jgi:hypothetical protein
MLSDRQLNRSGTTGETNSYSVHTNVGLLFPLFAELHPLIGKNGVCLCCSIVNLLRKGVGGAQQARDGTAFPNFGEARESEKELRANASNRRALNSHSI